MSLLALRWYSRSHVTWITQAKYCISGQSFKLATPCKSKPPRSLCHRPLSSSSASRNEKGSLSTFKTDQDARNRQKLLRLVTCHGCGAAVQTGNPELPGYFSTSRRAVLSFIQASPLEADKRHSPVEVPSSLLECPDHVTLEVETTNNDMSQPPRKLWPHERIEDKQPPAENITLSKGLNRPLCDRCHQLIHHNSGSSIVFPSVQALTNSILESPFLTNHIYHVIDAVDFPFSVIPDIHRLVPVMSQRTRNRRAKHDFFLNGRKTGVTYVITRSDLLAPRKEMVDSIMPYLVDTLRQSLHPSLRNVRLGNVRCVSAKRGWWTKVLKDDIRGRIGGCWLVGKVNVGKSSLFEAVFPKGGRTLQPDSELSHERDGFNSQHRNQDATPNPLLETIRTNSRTNYLLPPARSETQYPEMPIASSFPGTTASPIRIPFGDGRGELIDLPGLPRSSLDTFVKPEHRHELIMKTRVQPKQYVVKPGQSLLLGGLFCITAGVPDLTLLVYPFVNLEAHITSIEKASEFCSGSRIRNIPSIATTDPVNAMASAGSFTLQWDVTQQRAGLLLSPKVTKWKAHNLPFRVMSADIIIEGCGWVEVVAQVRRYGSAGKSALGVELRDSSSPAEMDTRTTRTEDHPFVKVFSPEGRFVDVRKPLGAWLLSERPRTSSSQQKGRPRRSIRSMKGSARRRTDNPHRSKLGPT